QAYGNRGTGDCHASYQQGPDVHGRTSRRRDAGPGVDIGAWSAKVEGNVDENNWAEEVAEETEKWKSEGGVPFKDPGDSAY
ncbi:hypothetical protein LTS18_013937, partial [Coniosporium uncinatum]